MDFVQQELDGVPQSTLIPTTHLAAFSSTLLFFFSIFFFSSPARTNSPCAVGPGWLMALDYSGLTGAKKMKVT